ncbi:MAG: hypothetical protein RL885_32305 [Planctomycetota bacterium]
MFRLTAVALAGIAGALCLTPVAAAEGRTPGSLLIYPVYDSYPSSGTLISITNTKDDPSFNPNTNLNGVVDVHFIYIDGIDWSEFNRYERLTPNDNFTVVATVHNPNSETGFLYCIALDPTTRKPVAHNWLIGDEIIADGSGNWLYGFDAIAFKSLAAEGQPADLDLDDMLELDGTEYEAIPDTLAISSFLGVGPTDADLVLLSLVGDSDYLTRVDFEVFNDNEVEFSATYEFRCWYIAALTDIDQVFTDSFLSTTNIDPRSNGLGQTTGWVRIDGDRAVDVVANAPRIDDPPFLAAFRQSLSGISTGHLIHESDADNDVPGLLSSLR